MQSQFSVILPPHNLVCVFKHVDESVLNQAFPGHDSSWVEGEMTSAWGVFIL